MDLTRGSDRWCSGVASWALEDPVESPDSEIEVPDRRAPPPPKARKGSVAFECQEVPDGMEAFEFIGDEKQQVKVKVGGNGILTFLQRVFDLDPTDAEARPVDPIVEKAFVVDLHQPRYMHRSEALQLLREAMWLR